MTHSPYGNTDLAATLRTETRPSHEALDARMMGQDPFRDLIRYGRYLTLQKRLFGLVDPLYGRPAILGWFPEIGARSRLGAIEADLADVGVVFPFSEALTLTDTAAIGWLYVAEGSRLGGAHLAREAERLGFHAAFGARHLASDAENRGLAWNRFRAQLNAIALDAAGRQEAVRGAADAFRYMLSVVDETFEGA